MEVKVNGRGLPPAAGKPHAGLLDDRRVRAGRNEHDPFEQAGVGEVLNPLVPTGDIGHFVEQDKALALGRHGSLCGRYQAHQRVVIVDELAGEKAQPGRVEAGCKQVGHPLLEQGRLANLAAPAHRVNARLGARQAVEEGKAID